MLVPGKPTAYRPSESHIGTDRIERTLKVINRKQNKNKILTEGLELFALKETGSTEEKLEAMGVSYREVLEYIASIEMLMENRTNRKEASSENDFELSESNDEIVIIDTEETKQVIPIEGTRKKVPIGMEMITTMNRE